MQHNINFTQVVMRKSIIIAITLSIAFSSCNQNDDDVVSVPKSNINVLGQDYTSNLNSEGKYEDIRIDTILKNDFKAKHPLTRAITTTHDGIAQGTPKLDIPNQKVFITGIVGVASGPYIADIYKTSGTIELPDGVKDLYFDFPDVCGYTNWVTREEGAEKTSPQYKKPKKGQKNKISWYFYTIVLKYDIAGRQMWKVLPEDGAKILLPYTFIR